MESGQFETLKQSIAAITGDLRLPVLLIAFAFGAMLEGASGGDAPKAVTAAKMFGVGFPPFQTALLCLIANWASVAFGDLGNLIRTLAAATGLPEPDCNAMVGRMLRLTSLVLPFWLVRMMASTKDALAVWLGLLVCGISFASFQFFWSNFMNASLVDIVSASARC